MMTLAQNQDLLGMELKYDRVFIMYRNGANNNDNWIKKIHCTRQNCTRKYKYMKNMKTHLNWHNGLKKHYDIYCPYCPEDFAHLGTLSRHIHNKHCPGIDYTNPTWGTIWNDICSTNV